MAAAGESAYRPTDCEHKTVVRDHTSREAAWRCYYCWVEVEPGVRAYRRPTASYAPELCELDVDSRDGQEWRLQERDI